MSSVTREEGDLPHLKKFEIVAILCQQRLWWVVYRAKGQRGSVLSEDGVAPQGWLYPLLAAAEEEVAAKDRHIARILGLP